MLPAFGEAHCDPIGHLAIAADVELGNGFTWMGIDARKGHF